MRVLTYLGLMVGEWAVVLLLARRFGPRRLREWIGGAWHLPGSVAFDVGLGAALWLAWRLLPQTLSRLPFLGAPAQVDGLLCFGLLFGVVALWRRSLRPGMIAHAATDIMSGLFRL